jgi:uncharacterized protein (TIGR02598 family)
MKAFFSKNRVGQKQRGGFSLVEASFSIGLLSCGFLTLAPLLAMGLQSARLARDDRATAQIAQTLMQEAQQGTLGSGTLCFDFTGAPCAATQAVFTAQEKVQAVGGSSALSQLTLTVSPVGAPSRARTYALVFQAP